MPRKGYSKEPLRQQLYRIARAVRDGEVRGLPEDRIDATDYFLRKTIAALDGRLDFWALSEDHAYPPRA